jgi:hypothetical protein
MDFSSLLTQSKTKNNFNSILNATRHPNSQIKLSLVIYTVFNLSITHRDFRLNSKKVDLSRICSPAAYLLLKTKNLSSQCAISMTRTH